MNPLFFLERGIFLSCKQSVQIKKTILFYFFLFNRLMNLTVHHLPSSSFISSTWKFVAGLKLNNCALGGKKGKKKSINCLHFHFDWYFIGYPLYEVPVLASDNSLNIAFRWCPTKIWALWPDMGTTSWGGSQVPLLSMGTCLNMFSSAHLSFLMLHAMLSLKWQTHIANYKKDAGHQAFCMSVNILISGCWGVWTTSILVLRCGTMEWEPSLQWGIRYLLSPKWITVNWSFLFLSGVVAKPPTLMSTSWLTSWIMSKEILDWMRYSTRTTTERRPSL